MRSIHTNLEYIASAKEQFQVHKKLLILGKKKKETRIIEGRFSFVNTFVLCECVAKPNHLDNDNNYDIDDRNGSQNER